MIKLLKLKNFRNFEDAEFFFDEKINFIVGENGKGKTNILEAISLLSLNTINKIPLDYFIKKGKQTFYIEAITQNNQKVGISFDKEISKKSYIIDNKKTSKQKFGNIGISSVSFSPIVMNILYLSPSLRRDFLDTILENTFPEYSKILKNYKNILINRNKVLKNIKEQKSSKKEIVFWDQEFIKFAEITYRYRFLITDFFKKHIGNFEKYFLGKINNIEFIYKTKISKNTVKEDIKNYLDKNLDRDIILSSTHIGPHIDDFDILVDLSPIVDFASRGETKSVILGLKLLEIDFIEKYSQKKPILLIDDLISELDDKHKDMLIENIKGYQTFVSSIKKDDYMNNKSLIISL